MKRIIAIILSCTLLLISSTNYAFSAGINQKSSIVPPSNYRSTDELFQLRAQLLCDPNHTPEDLSRIDEELFALGVEPISAAEVAEKLDSSLISPMYTITSTADTLWYSERYITVWNGQRYEVQIVTGQAKNNSSPLASFRVNYERTYSRLANATGKALKVVAGNIITYGLDLVAPTVSGIISAGINMSELNSILCNNDDTLTNIEYTCDVALSTTMRYAFVKNEGAPDAGNQIQAYEGNSVNYTVEFSVPKYYTDPNATGTTDIESQKYNFTVTSHGFDIDTCKQIAAKNTWTFKYTNASFDVMETYYQITDIPITVFNTTYWHDVPWDYPPIN